MVERRKKRTAFLKRAQTVKPHGIQSLENVVVLAVLRSAAVLFEKALDFFEPGNNAFFPRGAAALLFGLGEVVVRWAAIAAATCFRLSSLMALARIA
jgi:hypothetical protein